MLWETLTPCSQPNILLKSISCCLCSLITGVSNGPSGITPQSANPTAIYNKSEKHLLVSSSIDSVKTPNTPPVKDTHQHQKLESSENAASIPLASGSYFSSSDPVLSPSQDSPPPSAVANIHHEVGSQQAPDQMVDNKPTGNKSTSPEICMLILFVLIYIYSF